MRMIFSTLLIAFSFFSTAIFAQQNWCATDEMHEEYLLNHPQLRNFVEKEQDRLFANSRQVSGSKMGSTITVPIVVHIIHDNGVGNISDRQVLDGIRVLNEDFQRINADTSSTRSVFQPYAAAMDIEFKLARIDPNGICTNGINRVNSELTYNARNNVKNLINWPTTRYLNVWLVESIQSSGTGVTLGFAQFPFFGINSSYGIVQRSDQWGAIEESNADGRTATHEMGHCFGLFHTFQSGCGGNCNTSGDEICDTPPVSGQTFGCVPTQNSCSNDASGAGSPYTTNVVDQVENYMSYDACQNMFSEGQKAVMESVIAGISGLANLTSQSNLVATGTDSNYVDQDCQPIAEFIYPSDIICAGMMVTYTDISYNGSISNRTWSFPGGSPSTSSDSIVTVTYSAAGTYGATLNVSNPQGSDSQTYTNVVRVEPSEADFTAGSYQEGMETNTFDDHWEVIDPNGNRGWEVTSDAAFTGDRSVYIYNFIGNTRGHVDEFISPSFNLSTVNAPELFFKVAYARRNSSNEDGLRVYYSINCGQSWFIRYARVGDRLETTEGPTNSAFIPQDESEWEEVSITLPSSAQNSENVLFRFEFTADGGNNIYIDDINIQNPTGVRELSGLLESVNVFPNPTNGLTQLSIDAKETLTGVDVFVSDVSGRRVITSMSNNTLRSGTHQILLETEDLPSDLYFVNIVTGKGRLVEKLVVN